MQIVIAHAAPPASFGTAWRTALRLPALEAALAHAAAGAADPAGDDADEWTLSAPHERALAQAHGWHGGDGLLPWAAQQAAADGLAVGDAAWALLTPSHWRPTAEQVTLLDPQALQLGEAESRALFALAEGLLATEGFRLHWAAPLRWYAAHPVLATLPAASPERVVGRGVERFLSAGRDQRLVRRLQNEVQMLLHDHPLNRERESRGLPAVNSVWISGCGRAQPVRGDVQLESSLLPPVLADDPAAWLAAWQRIDAGWPARGASSVTLCGERRYRRFELRRPGLIARLAAPLRRSPPLAALLEEL